jgi:uncharacterized protein DUF6590
MVQSSSTVERSVHWYLDVSIDINTFIPQVFKALWPEMLGQSNESVTTTPDSRFGENIATKIRWFIVVREGKNQCSCM